MTRQQFQISVRISTLILVVVGGLCLTTPVMGEVELSLKQKSTTSTLSVKNLIKDSKNVCLDLGEQTQPISRIQIDSLLNVYHAGRKSLTEKRRLICMTSTQYKRAQEKFRSLNHTDRQFFNTHLQPKMLIMLALRDSDGDGILDFRIKREGTFLANDTDADNDGISNLFDPRPQTAGTIKDKICNNDADKDGLPDHLDWSNTNRFDFVEQGKHGLIHSQLSAFKKYGIVYMQGNSVFMPELADLAMDVFNIFATQYQQYNLQANAQSFTTADQYDVTVNEGVIAEVSPVNGQIIIYEEGMRNILENTDNFISTLLTVIHEFTHAIQNAMDYPQNQKALLEQNRHLQPTVFVSYVNRLGWNLDTENRKETLPNYGYVNHDEEIFAPVEIYKNRKLTTIADICDNEKHPSQDTAKRKIWKSFNGVHCYAFDSVREWHAEYVVVTVLSAMYSRLKQTHRKISTEIIRRAQEKIKQDFDGEGYDYKNADKKAVNMIAEYLRISPVLLDQLNEKYLIEPFSA